MEEGKDKKEGKNLNRQLRGYQKWIFDIIACILALSPFYWTIFGVGSIMNQRAIFIVFTLILVFMSYKGRKNAPSERISLPDLFLIVLSLGVSIYAMSAYGDRINRFGLANNWDLVFGIMLSILGLEMVRRVAGWTMVILPLIFVVYACWGYYLPGILAHSGYGIESIVGQIFCGFEGIYGSVTGAVITYVLAFTVFGSFLEKSGAIKFFIDLAFSVTKKTVAGPAKAAVIASGLFGMISGSSVANAAAVGSFTIPMMKRTGYEPHVAAAIETASSVGGQIMPPIMGAAIFIMVEFTRITYLEIVSVSFIPAAIYYMSIFLHVHFRGKKLGLGVATDVNAKSLGQVFRQGWPHILPLLTFVVVLISGFTPMMSALIAIISLIFVGIVRREFIGFRNIFNSLVYGAVSSLSIGCLSAAIGIMVGLIALTGLGLKFTTMVISQSGGQMLLTIFFVFVTAYIMGMGLPSVPIYIILSVIVGPVMSKLGIPVLASHLMIIWFGLVSHFTPPVALTAFVAAGIAGANFTKTGYKSLTFSLGMIIIPLFFVFRPSLIFLSGSVVDTAITTVAIVLGFFSLASSIDDFLIRKTFLIERIILMGSAFLLFYPNLPGNAIGVALLGAIFFLQKASIRKLRPSVDSTLAAPARGIDDSKRFRGMK